MVYEKQISLALDPITMLCFQKKRFLNFLVPSPVYPFCEVSFEARLRRDGCRRRAGWSHGSLRTSRQGRASAAAGQGGFPPSQVLRGRPDRKGGLASRRWDYRGRGTFYFGGFAGIRRRQPICWRIRQGGGW